MTATNSLLLKAQLVPSGAEVFVADGFALLLIDPRRDQRDRVVVLIGPLRFLRLDIPRYVALGPAVNAGLLDLRPDLGPLSTPLHHLLRHPARRACTYH